MLWIARLETNEIEGRISLEMLPVSGFDGNILLRPIENKPDAPPLPDPDEHDDDDKML